MAADLLIRAACISLAACTPGRLVAEAGAPRSRGADAEPQAEESVEAAAPDPPPRDASSPSSAPCPSTGPSAVAVRFDVRRRTNRTMVAAIAIPALGFTRPVFDSAAPDVCGSTVDRDGSRMLIRCKGDLTEARAEVVREEAGLRVRVASGYFGPMPGGHGNGPSLDERFVPMRCGANVTFEPHNLSDWEAPPAVPPAGFFREVRGVDAATE